VSLLFAFIWLPLNSEWALYVLFFGILVFSGIGLPVPEEVTLLLGGYLAYLGFIGFWQVLYVLIAGIIFADMLGYFLGRFAGDWVSGKFSRFQTSIKILENAKLYFDRHGEKMVLFSRPLVGVRVAVPILAGHFRMSFTKFLIYDALGAIPWTFALVSVSYYFGVGLDWAVEVRELKHIILSVAVLALALWIGIKLWRARFAG
jgi:membrane protein DedA with SNARE-associated domain